MLQKIQNKEVTYVRVKYYVYLFLQLSKYLKSWTAAACRKLHCRMQIFSLLHEPCKLRENYRAGCRLTSMATKSMRRCRHARRGTECVYTWGKFDFVVGLQYSIISWVDQDATSAVENPPYSNARSLPPSACYIVRGWRRGGFIDALSLGWKWWRIHYWKRVYVLCNRRFM